MPSRANVSLWRFSGRCWPNLASRMLASSSGPARPRGMTWNGGGHLRDGLARPAGEALAHGLDDLELARDDLERLGHVLAELGQLALAAGAGCRAGDHHSLTRQMGGERCADRLAAGVGGPGRIGGRPDRAVVLGGGGLGLLQLQLELVEQLATALGRGAEPVVPHLGDDELEMRDDGLGAGRPLLGDPPGSLLGQQRRAECGDVVDGRGGGGRHTWIQAQPTPRRVLRNASRRSFLASARRLTPPPGASRCAAGFASRCRRACNRAGLPRWTPHPASAWAR